MINKLSPIQKLRLRKLEISKECDEIERSLLEDVAYLKKNSSSLVISHMFSVSGQNTWSTLTKKISSVKGWKEHIFPVVWGISRPLLVNLAIKEAKNLIFGSKRRKKSREKNLN